MVIKAVGQILGASTNVNTGWTTITIVTPQNQLVVTTPSPSIAAAISVGQTITFYTALTPADVSAIEAAVPTISINSPV